MSIKMIIISVAVWLVATVFYSLDYFQHASPSVLLMPIAVSMHMDVNTVVGVMAIYWPVYAISQLPVGWLLDRYGYQWVLPICCTIMSAAIVIFSHIPVLPIMWLARIFIAIGSAAAFLGVLKVAAMMLPNSIFPVAVGLTNTIGTLSAIFGQVLLSYGITHLGWQNALSLIGYFGLIYGVVLYLCLRIKTQTKHSNISRKLSLQHLGVLQSKELWFIALYAGLMVGTVVNAFSELFDVVFLQYTYHLTAIKAASISSTIFIGIAVGGPSHGVISALIGGKKRSMIIANLLTIVIFGIIVLLPAALSVLSLYVLYFSLGFFISSMLLAFSVVNDIFPNEMQGTVLAIVNMVIGLCAAFFQRFIGHVSACINGGDIKMINNPHVFTLSFIFLLCPLMLSFVLLLFTRTRYKVMI